LNSNAEALSKQPNFEEIYKRFRPGLIHFACTITRNMADAEEVVNDVFMAIWERHSELLEQESIKAELMDITPKTVENQIGLALKFLKENF